MDGNKTPPLKFKNIVYTLKHGYTMNNKKKTPYTTKRKKIPIKQVHTRVVFKY